MLVYEQNILCLRGIQSGICRALCKPDANFFPFFAHFREEIDRVFLNLSNLYTLICKIV